MRWKGKLRRYPIRRRLPLDDLAFLRPARPRVRGRGRHHLSGRGGVAVALDATKEQALQDVSLIKLFEDHRDLWKADAKSAYEFSAGFLEIVRPDDLLKPLLPVLEVAPTLREYLARNKLTQKYWYERFGELIVDRLWEELRGGPSKRGKGR